MINLKQELQNYPPINLSLITEDETVISDNIKNSIILYNKSLENLSMGSEDIAIIELKKAISLNPQFHEAMNLLGICYSYINNQELAAKMFERVVAAENNSVKAIRYLGLLNSNEVVPSNSQDKTKRKAAPSINKNLTDNIKIKAFSYKYLIPFAVGITLTILVFLIVSPSLISGSENDNKSTTVSNDKNVVAETDKTVKDLKSANSKLKHENKLLTEASDKTGDLFEIEKLVRSSKYESAASKIINLKTIKFTGNAKNEFKWLSDRVMPSASNISYYKGYNLMNSGRYTQAIDMYNKAELYGNGYTNVDKILYYLGKSYLKLNKTKNASDAFKSLIKRYPHSSYSSWATYELDKLKK